MAPKSFFDNTMTFVCGTQPYNPKIAGTQQVVLYAMSFFTTIACRLSVFIQNQTQQGLILSLQDLAMTVANLVVIHQLNFLDYKDKSKECNEPVIWIAPQVKRLYRN